MSLRLEMLDVARQAPHLLTESTELVKNFLQRQQNPDGGFKNRQGQSDLYYSVFGIEALMALECGSPLPLSAALESLKSYLGSFGSGDALDLVHLCCLVRCWADLQTGGAVPSVPEELKQFALSQLEHYRAKDGGYNPVPGSQFGTPYGCFLVLGAYQDLQTQLPDRTALLRCLMRLQNENGSWDNALQPSNTPTLHHSASGATNATAAALTTLHQTIWLSDREKPRVGNTFDWLLARCHPLGGFRAGPTVPMPDLLSTATALHALAVFAVPLQPIREKCLDYLDSLWTNQGSFHGHWLDETLDCEYTFYALLALGHLT